MSRVFRSPRLALLAAATLATAWACNETSSPDAADPAGRTVYGTAIRLGNGRARTYAILKEDGTTPVEVGVALDSAAMDGLPAPMQMPADGAMHEDMHMYELAMPAVHGSPYRFVELDWNPQGHGAPYDTPHFDFHFYTITTAQRDGIDPAALGAAQFAARSVRYPEATFMPTGYVAIAAPGQPVTAVPRMGTHWVDLTAPELQGMLGHPDQYRPFTTTFINGTWDGKFIFSEPMITRQFIMSRRTAAGHDSTITIPTAQRADVAGWYPGAYRVSWDAAAHEYRIAMTKLAWLK